MSEHKDSTQEQFVPSTSAYLLNFFVAFVGVSSIFFFADGFFGFNLLSPAWEEILGFLIVAAIITALSLLVITFSNTLSTISDFASCYTNLHGESVAVSRNSKMKLNRKYFFGFAGALLICFGLIKGLALYDLAQKDKRLAVAMEYLQSGKESESIIAILKGFDFAIGEDVTREVTDKIDRGATLTEEEESLRSRFLAAQDLSGEINTHLEDLDTRIGKQELSVQYMKLVERVDEKKYRTLASTRRYEKPYRYHKESLTKEERQFSDEIQNAESVSERSEIIAEILRRDGGSYGEDLAIPFAKIGDRHIHLIIGLSERE